MVGCEVVSVGLESKELFLWFTVKQKTTNRSQQQTTNNHNHVPTHSKRISAWLMCVVLPFVAGVVRSEFEFDRLSSIWFNFARFILAHSTNLWYAVTVHHHASVGYFTRCHRWQYALAILSLSFCTTHQPLLRWSIRLDIQQNNRQDKKPMPIIGMSHV